MGVASLTHPTQLSNIHFGVTDEIHNSLNITENDDDTLFQAECYGNPAAYNIPVGKATLSGIAIYSANVGQYLQPVSNALFLPNNRPLYQDSQPCTR